MCGVAASPVRCAALLEVGPSAAAPVFCRDGLQAGQASVGSIGIRRNRLPAIQPRIVALAVVTGAMAWFELAGPRFNQPKVIFVSTKSGPVADPDTAGDTGLGFLQPRNLVWDYANKRIGFE